MSLNLHVNIKDVNRLAIPSMLAGITEPLLGIADTAIIGHVPENSAEALAGVGISAGFFLFMFWTFVQIETALSAIIARYYGAGKLKETQDLVMQTMVLNIVVGIFLWLLCSAFSDGVFDLYHAKGLQKKFAMEYFSIRSLGFPLGLVTWGIWGVFRGMQNTSWAMFIMLAGGVLNLLLDFLLVFGWENWIPAMGVKGAALATCISQLFMVVISIIVLLKKTPFRLRLWAGWHPEFGRMLAMSGSFIIRTLALNLVLFAASASATELGPQVMAAHAIAIQLWLLSAFFIDGYANAGLALSGKLLGEENWVGIKNLVGRLMKIGFGVSGVIVLVYGATYFWMGSWFSNEMEVVAQFNSIFWLVILGQPFGAVAFTLDGFLKGLGASRSLMYMMLVALLVFVVVDRLSSINSWGFMGVWMALLAWMGLRAVWAVVYMKRRLRTELYRTS